MRIINTAHLIVSLAPEAMKRYWYVQKTGLFYDFASQRACKEICV